MLYFVLILCSSGPAGQQQQPSSHTTAAVVLNEDTSLYSRNVTPGSVVTEMSSAAAADALCANAGTAATNGEPGGNADAQVKISNL